MIPETHFENFAISAEARAAFLAANSLLSEASASH